MAGEDDSIAIAARMLVRDSANSWQLILREHVADASGHCRGCPSTQGRPVFPCTVFAIGRAARDLSRSIGGDDEISRVTRPG